MFQQSKLVFDDKSRLINITLRSGLCPGTKHQMFPYSDIGNLAIVRTGTRINGTLMHKTIIILRDGTEIQTGRLESQDDAFAFAKEIHRFIFGRSDCGSSYVPPTMKDLLLSSY